MNTDIKIGTLVKSYSNPDTIYRVINIDKNIIDIQTIKQNLDDDSNPITYKGYDINIFYNFRNKIIDDILE